MSLESGEVVRLLLSERVRLTAAANVVVKDLHAAEDVYQQVVTVALQQTPALVDPSHVLAWGLRACRHRAVKVAQRKRIVFLPDEVLDALEERLSGPNSAGTPYRSEALGRCLEQLPGVARELLRLKHHDGLSGPEIARRLGRTADAVYKSLFRVHRLLRECVEQRMLPEAVQ